MVEKAQAETQIFLASLSKRRGKKVTIEGKELKNLSLISPVPSHLSLIPAPWPSDLTEEESEKKCKARDDGIVVNIRHPTECKDNKHVQKASRKTRVEPPESKAEPQISDDMLKELILRVGSS